MPAILNSWKEIATYMNRGVRTVQRWEEGGLPIRRVGRGERGPVFAFTVDIDKWLRKHDATALADHATAAQSDARKLVADSQQLVSTLQRSGADFLFLDLDIATTMAHAALKAGSNTEKRARTQRIARRAYNTILYLSQRFKMTKQESSELREKLATVKRELEQLEERS
jgi:phage terminase Nu1 subunit (DNA packaging protein)